MNPEHIDEKIGGSGRSAENGWTRRISYRDGLWAYANALDEKAVEKIFQARADLLTILIVHISEIERLNRG